MPGETGARPLLPQTAQMQSFTFAPPALAPRENQRSESSSRDMMPSRAGARLITHCRLRLRRRAQQAQALERCAAPQHKKLPCVPPLTSTVMRACEGCRRRKIKCDAATTNAWPCAACIRLKLNCVPPTVSYDKDFNATTQTYELEEKPLEYTAAPNSFHQPPVMPTPQPLSAHMTNSMPASVSAPYTDGMRLYQNPPYPEQRPHDHVQYAPMPQQQVVQQNLNYAPQLYSDAPAPAPSMTMTPPETEGHWKQDSTSNLADALGELKIEHDAVGKRHRPHISRQC